MPIIVIKLNTDNPQDVEILRLINNRLLGLEETVLKDYDDFWARASKRTREVLKLWSESHNQEPRKIIKCAHLANFPVGNGDVAQAPCG